jgi:hypothetical protein
MAHFDNPRSQFLPSLTVVGTTKSVFGATKSDLDKTNAVFGTTEWLSGFLPAPRQGQRQENPTAFLVLRPFIRNFAV